MCLVQDSSVGLQGVLLPSFQSTASLLSSSQLLQCFFPFLCSLGTFMFFLCFQVTPLARVLPISSHFWTRCMSKSVFISPYPYLQHLQHELSQVQMQTCRLRHARTHTHAHTWATETYMFSVLNSFRKTQRTVSNFLPSKACVFKSNAMSFSTYLSTAVSKQVLFRIPHNVWGYDMSKIDLSKPAQSLLETYHEHILAFPPWQMSSLLYSICLDSWEHLPKAVTGYRKQQSPVLWNL